MEFKEASSRRVGLGAATLGMTSAAAISAAFGQTVVASNDAAKTRTVETVVVTGQRTTARCAAEEILDTPQSINVVPPEVIKQQGVNNLAGRAARMCPASR